MKGGVSVSIKSEGPMLREKIFKNMLRNISFDDYFGPRVF